MKNITRESAMKLIDDIQDMIQKQINLEPYFEKDLLKRDWENMDVKEEYEGVSNGFLSEVIHAITGYDVEVYGEVEKLFVCPCCGLRTLTEIYNPTEGTGYDICPYCKWEDDGTTDEKAYRSINRGEYGRLPQ